MVLRPILDPIHTLDVILKNDEFSWIFEIFICGSNYSNYEIGRYRPENHDLTSEISSLMLELHYIQNGESGEVIWPISAIFPQKHPFFGKPTNDFFHLWVSVEYSTPSEISTIKKYGPSAFQRIFERPYSPPRSKVITIWSSKMLLSVSFPGIHHVWASSGRIKRNPKKSSIFGIIARFGGVFWDLRCSKQHKIA